MASSTALEKSWPIAIIGAGVFGLSTALDLARRGYTNVTVFDKQPYWNTKYDFDSGCDAASADTNKIIRAAYEDKVEYQNLALEAIEQWEAWNKDLARGSDLPDGMTIKDRIYVNTGVYRLGDDSGALNAFEKASIENLAKAGKGNLQYLLDDPAKVERARNDGYGHGIDPFRLASGGKHAGYLDMVGGFVYADKACRYALHKARGLGVKFVLDDVAGRFRSFKEDANGRVTGIITDDGRTHPAAVVVVACGAWTPSILPEIDGLCEATAGSIALIQIPPIPRLRQRFSPENFPVWYYRIGGGEYGDVYGFPIDERGVMKIGYRGTKFTNPQRVDDTGREQSVPITRWTKPSVNLLPHISIKAIRNFIDTYLPELRKNAIDIAATRLCWYTDSFDNHFVIDAVPNRPGVIVATGGSGHAFKFLPVLGRFVADRIEGKESDKIMEFWRWRRLKDGEKPVNVLGQGSRSPTALVNVKMSKSEDLRLWDMSYRARL